MDDEEFFHMMREERARDMMRPGSTSMLIHRFSMAFPAHVVATVMCVWLILSILISSMLVFHTSRSLGRLEERVKIIESGLAPSAP